MISVGKSKKKKTVKKQSYYRKKGTHIIIIKHIFQHIKSNKMLNR